MGRQRNSRKEPKTGSATVLHHELAVVLHSAANPAPADTTDYGPIKINSGRTDDEAMVGDFMDVRGEFVFYRGMGGLILIVVQST